MNNGLKRTGIFLPHFEGNRLRDFPQALAGILNKDNVYIIAFVNKTGTSATTYEIMNVQQGKLGVLKNWD